jgi:hypothetical protein
MLRPSYIFNKRQFGGANTEWSAFPGEQSIKQKFPLL